MVSLLIPFSSYAASFGSDESIALDLNEIREFGTFIIEAENESEITAQNGIYLLLDFSEEILWEKNIPLLFGSAVDSGKVEVGSLSYVDGYKKVFIPVLQDFEVGDELYIEGLSLRSYQESFGVRYLELDLNADGQGDGIDINTYRVNDVFNNDQINPYPVQNITYTILNDSDLMLAWDPSPDYDYDKTLVERNAEKNGVLDVDFIYSGFATEYKDVGLNWADYDKLSYSFIAQDENGQWSEPVMLEIDLEALSPEEVLDEEGEIEIPADEEGEAQQFVEIIDTAPLLRLMNYYHVRYQIKCLNQALDDYACRWTKIDLLYAQELTGETLVDDLTLSKQDLERMAATRQWPERRYQNNCVDVVEPATYCSSLEDGLDRLSYFLD